MSKVFKFLSLTVFALHMISINPVYAEEGKKPKGPPPAVVVVSPVGEGMIAPEAEFIGTVYYKEVTDLAAEVEGKVEAVRFEEGQRVKKGSTLVKIDARLLGKEIKSKRASREEVLAELEKLGIDLKRAKTLHEKKLLSDKDYDGYRFAVKGLEMRALSMEADIERLEIELAKKSITSPFDGIVLKRTVDVGEWLAPGKVVASVALIGVFDVVVNVPQSAIPFIKSGAAVSVTSGGRTVKGKIFAVIPSGDISTRTFPVKIRVKDRKTLAGGMEARVRLPVGKRQESLVVNRDALTSVFGTTALYAVIDSKAVMFPVKVIGYDGMKAGVRARGLKKGMNVVVKGNERLSNGQNVMIMRSNK